MCSYLSLSQRSLCRLATYHERHSERQLKQEWMDRQLEPEWPARWQGSFDWSHMYDMSAAKVWVSNARVFGDIQFCVARQPNRRHFQLLRTSGHMPSKFTCFPFIVRSIQFVFADSRYTRVCAWRMACDASGWETEIQSFAHFLSFILWFCFYQNHSLSLSLVSLHFHPVTEVKCVLDAETRFNIIITL